MDATSTEAAVLAGICGDGVWPSVQLAAAHPERVLGIVALAPGIPLITPPHPFKAAALEHWDEELDRPEGWEKYNRHYIRADQRGFLEFFFGEMFPEPYSTKHVEDAVAYGLDGPAEGLVMDDAEPVAATKEEVEQLCRAVRCPVLVVHGDRDNCQPFERGHAFAELTGAEFVGLAGAGHIPNARHPVLVNQLMHEFAGRFAPPAPRARTWARAAAARRAGRCSSLADRTRSRLARRRDRARAPASASRARGPLARAAPRDHAARGLRRDGASGERGARLRGRGRGCGSGRARAPRVPDAAPPRRDLLRQLHGLPRPRPRGARSTSGSPTRPGRSTTSCTRTRS